MDIQKILKIDLIKALGLDKIAPDKKEELLLLMGQVINQNIFFRILDALDEKGKDEFDKVSAADNPDKIYEFLSVKIPNLNEIAMEEVAKFKERSIEMIQPYIKDLEK